MYGSVHNFRKREQKWNANFVIPTTSRVYSRYNTEKCTPKMKDGKPRGYWNNNVYQCN